MKATQISPLEGTQTPEMKDKSLPNETQVPNFPPDNVVDVASEVWATSFRVRVQETPAFLTAINSRLALFCSR